MRTHAIQGEIFQIVPASTPDGKPGVNRAALDTYLAELDEYGLLNGKAAALGESLKTIADAVDRGMLAPKISIATTTLTKTLHEGLALLPEARRANSTDAYDTLTEIITGLTQRALNGEDNDAPEY